jgi:exodeoxyribonuclease V alpha subunit
MKADFSPNATGLLRIFHQAGIIAWGDIHVATKVGYLCGEHDERVLLGCALAVRALRAGSTCLDFTDVRAIPPIDEEDYQPVNPGDWPQDSEWIAALQASPMVAVGADAPSGKPLRWMDGLLYLERYWQEESLVAAQLRARRNAVSTTSYDADTLDELFTGIGSDEQQKLAIAVAACCGVSVIAGGPGTGKTATIARLLALLLSAEPGLQIALAAPTGKAAARMEEAISSAVDGLPARFEQVIAKLKQLHAGTLHRLLGWTPISRTQFVHNQAKPLPHDVVIVDEASMVSVVLMSRLLAALRPDAKLVLVGDPEQLAPVEAGAVLADIVSRPGDPPGQLAARLQALRLPPATSVVRLTTNHRSSQELARLAAAVQAGDADLVVKLATDAGILFAEVAESGLRQKIERYSLPMLQAARAGDAASALAALAGHRLLCGHRTGPEGVAWWTKVVEEWLGEQDPLFRPQQVWYPGRPVLVTQNSPDIELFNGDTGVVVANPQGLADKAFFERGGSVRGVGVHLLSDVETAHVMTVHKAQGSQFESVSLILPRLESPLLNRELLYTAITRAERQVTLIGSAEQLRHAVTHPAQRASGLARNL